MCISKQRIPIGRLTLNQTPIEHVEKYAYLASFTSGQLPKAWLGSSVTPMYKKGDKLQADNYRPISIAPTVVKIAEKIILNKLLPFALNTGIIPVQQHGFVPGRSVITNLLYCVDSWTASLDRKRPVDVIYFDFAKAFDRVPKMRLLHKLEHFGIRGTLLAWIDAFLTDREFFVRVGDARSSVRTVLSGVPQGSVLGPALFLIYISDLAAILKSKFSFYADDLKIFADAMEGSHTLQEDLDAVSGWSEEWLLPLNTEKCSVLHLGTSNLRHRYRLNGVTVKSVDVQNDLGVLITSNLSWSEHILHVTKRANKLMYLIRKAFQGCSLQVYSGLFTVYVRPLLEFAGPVWCPILVRDMQLLESVQRRATRMPFGPVRPAYEERLRIFHLTSFQERRLRGDLIIVYRIIHNLLGVDLNNLFVLNMNNLRGHSLKLRKENFGTTVRQMFLSNRVFDTWNGLPEEVISAPSVNAFKNRLDRVLFVS